MTLNHYPYLRMRRLRANAAIREMMTENFLQPADFIAPLFIIEGKNKREVISSMPDYYRTTLDLTLQDIQALYNLGVKAVMLFIKVPDNLKDNTGKEALNPEGLMQKSIRSIKEKFPDVLVFTDVALDPYSIFGHDGIVEDGQIINDTTVEILAQVAISHAAAGADFVSPSDMMDGRIGEIRKALTQQGYHATGILAYSAKYASCFYGPFRDALDSAPGFGDKKTYQMNPANSNEALREIELDIQEGADIVMVKPGMPYLDIIRLACDWFNIPIAAYQVSGEYSMIKAAAAKGWINETQAMMESLIAFKRAGASLILTYFAKPAAAYLAR